MTTVSDTLFEELKRRGTDVIFGIPGVHTVELYRSLAAAGIRHVTPRHEQGAGFMADGFARVSGRPGVALVITGPGLTNTLTPMAQARADSVPMLVLSSVNARDTLGKGMGHLHELPDQHALARQVALVSEHLSRPDQIQAALHAVLRPFAEGRPGPAHIQIPLDLAASPSVASEPPEEAAQTHPDPEQISLAAELLRRADRPVILVGGGARRAGNALRDLAHRLDAPVVQTVNARGVLFGDPLGVPASPSLQAVRDLIEDADTVLALGTELGPTDYDMDATGAIAAMTRLIRVDICPKQVAGHLCELGIVGDAAQAISDLLDALPSTPSKRDGAARAERAREQAWADIGAEYQAQVRLLEAIRRAVPNSIMVGDSTQPIYAGNLYYDHDRAGGWFNAATGYGALGYGIPAAIGASIAEPGARVICIVGDGGAQFSLPEIMVAVDENLPVTFLIWNNSGYLEIARSMRAVDAPILGCTPSPPDFEAAARSFGLPYARCGPDPETVALAIASRTASGGPDMIEISAGAVADLLETPS